jgi:hypothetical protein
MGNQNTSFYEAQATRLAVDRASGRVPRRRAPLTEHAGPSPSAEPSPCGSDVCRAASACSRPASCALDNEYSYPRTELERLRDELEAHPHQNGSVRLELMHRSEPLRLSSSPGSTSPPNASPSPAACSPRRSPASLHQRTASGEHGAFADADLLCDGWVVVETTTSTLHPFFECNPTTERQNTVDCASPTASHVQQLPSASRSPGCAADPAATAAVLDGYALGSPLLLLDEEDQCIGEKPSLPRTSVVIPLTLISDHSPQHTTEQLLSGGGEPIHDAALATATTTTTLRCRLSQLMVVLGGSVSGLWGGGGGGGGGGEESAHATLTAEEHLGEGTVHGSTAPGDQQEQRLRRDLSLLQEQVREDQARRQADIELLRGLYEQIHFNGGVDPATLVPLIHEAQRVGAVCSTMLPSLTATPASATASTTTSVAPAQQLYPSLPTTSPYACAANNLPAASTASHTTSPGPSASAASPSSAAAPPPPPPPPPQPAPGSVSSAPKISWREKQALAEKNAAQAVPGRVELEARLRALITESDVTPANRAKVCTLWLEKVFRDLPQVNVHLACALEHYAFLVRELALKPVQVFKRMRLWERLLFEQLPAEEATRTRKRKTMEITRLQSEAEIAAEVDAIRKVLRSEERKREQAKLRAESRRTMSSVVEELEVVIRERSDDQTERKLAESLLLDEAIDEEVDILSLL